MEKFILIFQTVSLSVVFYVVIYFLLTWHWPATLLSVFLCAVALYFLIENKEHANRARTTDLVSSLAPDHAPVSSRE
jgi:hypothetical protein